MFHVSRRLHAYAACCAALIVHHVARAQEAELKEDGAVSASRPDPAAMRADDEAAAASALAADAASAAAPSSAASQAAPARGGAGQSMNPDLSVIADVAAAYFSRSENLQGGGHDPSERGFNLQQLELALGSSVDPYFRFDANLVFALDGVEVEEAYATTLALPYRLQVRAGQFLTRFGRMNASHPHTWEFVDQPFALTRLFGGEGNRGLGLELSWLTPLPWYVELVGSTTQLGGSETARSFVSDDDLSIDGPEDLQYLAALKQFFPLTENWSLGIGLSGAFGPNSSGRNGGSQLYGTDLYLKWRPITYQSHAWVSLHAEWFYRRRQAVDGVLQDTNGFAALTWRFAQRWAAALRYEFGSAALDGDLNSQFDALDPDWTRSRHRISGNASFWPTEFSRLRLQVSADRPRWMEAPIWAVFFSLEVVTGAHGSHGF